MPRMGSLVRNVAVACAAAIWMASAAAHAPPQTTSASDTTKAASRFPPGPGRDALFKVCADCHGPESALGHLKTRDEWVKTLDDMASQGAQGTDEEWKNILEYLVTHYSLIFVNADSARDLATRLDVPAETADAIVRMRTERGKFTSIDDLKKVPGLEDKSVAAKLDARKDRMIF
jgi:competence protein ComEA